MYAAASTVEGERPMESGLQVSGLVTGYERQPTLHGVNLDIPRRSICAVVGPNGAGKTTLINCLIGLLPAWQGSVHWDGLDLSRASVREHIKASIAVVPQ